MVIIANIEWLLGTNNTKHTAHIISQQTHQLNVINIFILET